MSRLYASEELRSGLSSIKRVSMISVEGKPMLEVVFSVGGADESMMIDQTTTPGGPGFDLGMLLAVPITIGCRVENPDFKLRGDLYACKAQVADALESVLASEGIERLQVGGVTVPTDQWSEAWLRMADYNRDSPIRIFRH